MFPGASRPRGRPPSSSLAALVVTGCGGAAPATPPATPSGSADPTACAAAPAPPADQEGWTTAATEPTVFPAIVNSGGSLTCGENRLLFTFLDDADRTVASPDRAVTVAIYDLGRDGATPIQTTDGTFVWGIEGERGFYVANVTFPEAGDWGAEFTTQLNDAAPETIRMRFQVATSSPVVRVGDAAPASDTPTAASVDGDLARISTDAAPDPAFYQVSVKDALAAHDPFVLRLRDPEVLRLGPVRTNPRSGQGGRRGLPGRHLHQRRAVRHGVRRRQPQAEDSTRPSIRRS